MKPGKVWLVAAAALIAWDVVAALAGWQTLSEWVWETSPTHPLIPFAAGLLCGHLFWRK